ncbi:MAG: hypothetical protein J6Y19_10250, partial [Kiritimatiellae bacterium]|nr:hypothetical protein [Kiritimatiellia bacterium]
MGMVLGLSLDAAADTPGLCTLALGAAGGFAGLFRGRGRLAAAVCYVTANAIAAFWAAGPELRSALLYEGFVASVVFLLPTERFYVNLMPREQGMGKGAEAALADLLERTTLAASALRDLERLLEETPEAGVLIDPSTFAAMVAAGRAVEFTSASADEAELRATWTPADGPEGARGTVKYDVYVSTDLREGFVFRERVDSPEWTMPRDGEAPVSFWVVLVAE